MVSDDDDTSVGLGEWLAEWCSRHWVVVGTTIAMLALVSFVPGVWEQQVETHSRGGMSGQMSLAARGLWLSAIGLVIYLLAGIGGPRHWAMRPPTDGEIAVARWLMRAIGLLAMWFALYITIPR